MASEPILNEGSKFRSRDETKINPKTWFGSTNGWRLEAHDADAETTPPETTPIVGAPAATFESTTAAEHTETGAQLKHTHTQKTRLINFATVSFLFLALSQPIFSDTDDAERDGRRPAGGIDEAGAGQPSRPSASAVAGHRHNGRVRCLASFVLTRRPTWKHAWP